MSDSPLVSIVLPTLNGARFLAQALDACLAQRHRDWELVFVDGGSTDGTIAIIDRYCAADSRLRCARGATGLNLPASLNHGFREVRGAYLTWISDDNVYRPEALDTMVRHLDANPGTDVVYTAYTWIDAEGAAIERVAPPAPELLTYRNCIGLGFLYRRRVMTAVGDYPEDLYLAEDYDFWFRAFLRCTLQPLDVDTLMIRRHPASLTDRFPDRIRRVTHQMIERNLPELCRVRPGLGHETRLRVANEAMRAGDVQKARRHFFAAIRQRPFRTWTRLPSARLALVACLGAPAANLVARVARLLRGGAGGSSRR